MSLGEPQKADHEVMAVINRMYEDIDVMIRVM